MTKIKVKQSNGDQRATFLSGTIVPAVEREILHNLHRAKFDGTVTMEAETMQFLSDLKLLIDNYSLLFTTEVEIDVDEAVLQDRLVDINEKLATVTPEIEVIIPDKVKKLKDEKVEVETKISKAKEVKAIEEAEAALISEEILIEKEPIEDTTTEPLL